MASLAAIGRCELMRVDYPAGRFEKLGPVVDADGVAMYQCHDIVAADDGTLYACENDNPYRSSLPVGNHSVSELTSMKTMCTCVGRWIARPRRRLSMTPKLGIRAVRGFTEILSRAGLQAIALRSDRATPGVCPVAPRSGPRTIRDRPAFHSARRGLR